jgi:peptide/nickel transport system permease protein
MSDVGSTLAAPVELELAATPRRRQEFDLVAVVSVTVLVLIAIAGVLAPVLAPFDPYKQSLRDALLSPLSTGAAGFHLLGTDELGRDVFSRLLFGVRPLSIIVISSVTIASTIGLLAGLVAGISRGWVGTAIMRLADIQLSIPPIVLALVLAVVLQPGVVSAIVAIAVVTWPEYTRVVRAEVLRVRTLDYVQLAYVAGLSRAAVLRRHVLPSVLNSFVVLVTLNLSIAIIFSSALSFLGAGVQAPTPDWGNMLAAGTSYLESWWMVVMPGAAISITVLALNLLGDHMRDRMDPRFARARAKKATQ